jgi:flagellar motor protein MotB
MKIVGILFLCLAVPLAAHLSLAQTQDAKGCKDSPLLTRFPGSYIHDCTHSDDDKFEFPLPNNGRKKLEGDLTEITYVLPDSASHAQVVRNMLTALKTAAYTIDNGPEGSEGRITAHMGKTWMFVDFGGGNKMWLTILVLTPLTQDVVASAADLSNGITGSGHVVVNGILFDTAKADIKPESDPALAEVAKLLKGNPSLKVYVVGHTDNVGALAANIDLSKRRAAAVVLSLTTKYGVSAAQLQPYGDGPYAPVASNDSEEGRALNRRVELVKQ